MSKSTFLSNEKFFGHFIFGGNENRDTFSSFDQFCFVAGAIVSLPQSAASRKFFELSVANPGYDLRKESLIHDALDFYASQHPRSTNRFGVFPIMSSREFRIFTERMAQKDTFLINYWLSTSVVFAYIALLFSHHYLFHFLHARDVSADRLKHVLDRANHYTLQCRFLNTAAMDGGSFVLQGVTLQASLEPASPVSKELLFRAIMFAVFHEIAHIELGHFQSREKGLDKDSKYHQELEADEFALCEASKLHLLGPWLPVLGAAIALLGESVISARDDAEDMAAHPSLVWRVKRLCTINDGLLEKAAGDSWNFLMPYLTNLVANLNDRDRCPSWFGQDRRAILGLPPDYDFNAGPRIDFASAGERKILDPNKPKPASRKVTWKDE